MLTRKQQELLLLINQRLKEDGVPPSFDEMKDALNLKSKSGIHRLITALEERGFIKRLPNRARALEVLRLPEAFAAAGQTGAGIRESRPQRPGGFTPSVIKGGAAGRSLPKLGAEDGAISLPVMGRIAAGVPISAIQDHTHNISIPVDMIGPGNHFALTVSGDSMIDLGIHDGDTVIIRQTNSAEGGDVVVALVDDEEATLKKFRRKGDSIALEAANPAYETRIFRHDQVKVQGRLVGLIRRY